MGSTGYLLGFTGFHNVLPGLTRFYQVLPGFTRFYWVLLVFFLGFIEFFLV